MSHVHPTTVSSSPNFRLIFNDALDQYKKRTKNDLLAHPLTTQLKSCNSPNEILAVLQQLVQALDQSRTSDERWSRWLVPTVNVLYAFSSTLGEGVGLVFSPAKVIFAGVGVLLSAAKDVRASQDALIDIFERIEMFFRRLESYTEVPLTTEMTDNIVQIMAEVLFILGIATKAIKQGRIKKYMNKLIGRTDIEDALKKLDRLTHEEARIAIAENLKVTYAVDKKVQQMANDIDEVKHLSSNLISSDNGALPILSGKKLWKSTHKWLSPPDPSTNHSIACGTHHKKTATWFFQDSIFQDWKSTGSLLWILLSPQRGFVHTGWFRKVCSPRHAKTHDSDS